MLNFFTYLGILVFGIGLAGAHFEFLSPLLGSLVALAGVALLGLLFFAALPSIFRRKAKAPPRWLAFYFGLASLAALGYLAYTASLHPLHDITTDVRDPPKFLRPVYSLKVGKGSEYLDPSLRLNREYDFTQTVTQPEIYPGFEGLPVKAPAAEAYAAALKAIRVQLPDWRIVMDDGQKMHAEMEEESSLFHFVDDIALEARPHPKNPQESSLALRSRSRSVVLLGSDLGANFRRLRDLKTQLALAFKPLEEKFKQQAAARVATATASATATATSTAVKTAAPAPPKAEPKK